MNKLNLALVLFLSLFVIVTCYAVQADVSDEDEVYENGNVEPLHGIYEDEVCGASSVEVETVDIDAFIKNEDKQEATSSESTFRDADSIPNLSLLSELPEIRKGLPSQLLHRKGYTVSYNKDTMQPNWVAWQLTAEHTDGEWVRPSGNAFHKDSEVPSPRASNYDYQGSGWSRGHLCPAGDCKWDADAMYESFLLTNVCPQHERLNSGDWNDIEQLCRRWAKKYGKLYIVCGPIFYRQEHETIGANRIPVPEAFFKVVMCMKESPKGIGFICKNTEGNRKTDFYVNTIAQVERITGFCFFPQLDDAIVSQVKEKANLQEW